MLRLTESNQYRLAFKNSAMTFTLLIPVTEAALDLSLSGLSLTII
jgi:hypothetical protein